MAVMPQYIGYVSDSCILLNLPPCIPSYSLAELKFKMKMSTLYSRNSFFFNLHSPKARGKNILHSLNAIAQLHCGYYATVRYIRGSCILLNSPPFITSQMARELEFESWQMPRFSSQPPCLGQLWGPLGFLSPVVNWPWH
jgi:hypothetical protein